MPADPKSTYGTATERSGTETAVASEHDPGVYFEFSLTSDSCSQPSICRASARANKPRTGPAQRGKHYAVNSAINRTRIVRGELLPSRGNACATYRAAFLRCKTAQTNPAVRYSTASEKSDPVPKPPLSERKIQRPLEFACSRSLDPSGAGCDATGIRSTKNDRGGCQSGAACRFADETFEASVTLDPGARFFSP